MSARCDLCRFKPVKPVFWSTSTAIYLFSFLALFVLYRVKLNNTRYYFWFSFNVFYCFIFLQRVCTDIVEIFTKSNMVAHHDCVQDLVSEVTFRKVESMLQVMGLSNIIIIIIIIIVIIVIINIIIIILTFSSSSLSLSLSTKRSQN